MFGAPTNEPKVALTLPSKLVQMRAIEIQLRSMQHLSFLNVLYCLPFPASQILEICWSQWEQVLDVDRGDFYIHSDEAIYPTCHFTAWRRLKGRVEGLMA